MGDFYKNFIKRLLDIICSGLALLVLGIPMLIVALLIRIDMGSPVLFKQKRTGLNEEPFMLLKFRSMNDSRDSNGIYLPDEQRITPLGNFIRKTSIDELPSLINILKGEMSVIGPRPLLVRYLERFTDEQRKRHLVKPGLSAPSTVNGRNAQSWEHQFNGDVWYVEHVSFFVDAKSVIDTVKIVLSRKGATADDGDCRGEFIGTADIESVKNNSEGDYVKL